MRWGEEPRDVFEAAEMHELAEQCDAADTLEVPEQPDPTDPSDEIRLVRPLIDKKAKSPLQPESFRRVSLCISVS